LARKLSLNTCWVATFLYPVSYGQN
jgi:hypothetical protein